MSNLCLTPDDLINLTGKSRPSAQARVLQGLGIPYRTRPDGSLVVLRIHVEYETEEKQAPALRL